MVDDVLCEEIQGDRLLRAVWIGLLPQVPDKKKTSVLMGGGPAEYTRGEVRM